MPLKQLKWLFFCVTVFLVQGEYNTSRWATEIHTEIVTQTLATGCDPQVDKGCSGPTEKLEPSKENNIDGVTQELSEVTAAVSPSERNGMTRDLESSGWRDHGTTEDLKTGVRGETTEDFSTGFRGGTIVGEGYETSSSPAVSSHHVLPRTVANAQEGRTNFASILNILSNETTTEFSGASTEKKQEEEQNIDIPPCVKCQNVIRNPFLSDEQRLFESLFASYKKSLRPLRKGSDMLTVYFSLIIKDIIDVDERNQLLKLNVQLNETWVDHILHWNPEEFGGITELRIPASEMWIPDITLYNTGDSAVLAQGNVTSSNVILRYDGHVSLISKPFVQHSTCLLNIRYFPFDVQKCSLKFGSWTFDQRLVDLLNGTAGPAFKDFVPNEQWDLGFSFFRRNVEWYECCPQRYVDITLYMGLRRKPLYYIHKLVMPILLLSALSMVGFLMPYNVGVVKANLSISLFLSMTVFLLLVAETIPRTSTHVPLVTQYYITIMILIALSTAMNIAILNIFHLGKESAKDVPRWMRRVIFFYLARIMLMEDIVAYWKKTVKKFPQKSKDAAEREAMLRRQRWFASRYGIKYNPKENVLINNLKSDADSLESLLHVEHTQPEPEETFHEYDNIDEKIPLVWRVRIKNIDSSVSNIHKHMVNVQKKQGKLQKSKREWALVATVMDRLFFIIYASTTISLSFFILVLAPQRQLELERE